MENKKIMDFKVFLFNYVLVFVCEGDWNFNFSLWCSPDLIANAIMDVYHSVKCLQRGDNLAVLTDQ